MTSLGASLYYRIAQFRLTYRMNALQQKVDPLRRELEIVVPFTTKPLTNAALDKVEKISQGLDVRVKVVCVQAVPFPLPLSCPPVSISFIRQALEDLLSVHHAEAEIHVTRNLRSIWSTCIEPGSVIVIATTKHLLLQTKEERLAQDLREIGHEVFCFALDGKCACSEPEKETLSGSTKRRLIMRYRSSNSVDQLEQKGSPPLPLRGLLVLLFSLLSLLLFRAVSHSFPDGWIATLTLLAALGLVIAALVEVIRSR